MLRLIPYSEFYMWDVKRFVKAGLSSNYSIVSLGEYIAERREKVKLFNFPDEEFGILGVNNKEGVFDAYVEKGKNINQAYKVVKDNDLTYNPYRVNVGSIGLKTSSHQNNYISPAYVVIECKNGLSAEFLYKLFKTDSFSKVISDNTTGSVRQNLKFETLANIKIPLPSLSEQSRLISAYEESVALARQQETKAIKLEVSIDEYLYDVLGIAKSIETKKLRFRVVNFKDIERWSVDSLGSISKVEDRFKGKYPLIKFRNLILSYQYGLSEKSSATVVGVPMLRMNNISNAELDFSKLKFIKIDQSYIDKYKLCNGDLLFNRTNSKELVGKTALFETDDIFTFASYLIRIKVNSQITNNHFINFLFNSSILQYQKNLVSRQITGQANINAQEMQDFLFPLPPLDVQIHIAQHISGIKAKIKTFKDLAKKNRKKASELFELEILNN